MCPIITMLVDLNLDVFSNYNQVSRSVSGITTGLIDYANQPAMAAYRFSCSFIQSVVQPVGQIASCKEALSGQVIITVTAHG
jgi:hypothetical protein